MQDGDAVHVRGLRHEDVGIAAALSHLAGDDGVSTHLVSGEVVRSERENPENTVGILCGGEAHFGRDPGWSFGAGRFSQSSPEKTWTWSAATGAKVGAEGSAAYLERTSA